MELGFWFYLEIGNTLLSLLLVCYCCTYCSWEQLIPLTLFLGRLQVLQPFRATRTLHCKKYHKVAHFLLPTGQSDDIVLLEGINN